MILVEYLVFYCIFLIVFDFVPISLPWLTFVVASAVPVSGGSLAALAQAFACENLEEVGKTYLRADYSLMCHTADHNWYKVYSAIMILVSSGRLIGCWLIYVSSHGC